MVKRSISPFALLFTSVSAILGSGWLFTSFYAAELAGPAALIAWVLGGLSAIVIAFAFAELCTLLPITGSSTRIPLYTHGTLVSFLFSWVIWLSYASLAPTEVQAVIQYMSYFFGGLVHANGGLTTHGYWIAGILMLSISALNAFSLRWLLRCNSVLTLMKLVIPTLLAVVVIGGTFSSGSIFHPAGSVFMPNGWHGVVGAIATGGIVFAFNGFKQACELAGEATHPARALPFAIIGSIVVCLCIYLLLEVAFLKSITVQHLVHGWSQLQLASATDSNSPLAVVVQQQHKSWLLMCLYVGAIIGPLAAALMYVSSAGRSLFGMAMNEQVPGLFRLLTAQGNPAFAIAVNFMFGMFLFAPLPGWDRMITFLTSLMAITYAIGPVCLLALRKQLPEAPRPFRLRQANFWGFFGFYICTLLTYWSGWVVISKLSVALLIGFLVLFTHRVFLPPAKRPILHWQSSIWVWPYFLGITFFSYIGNFGKGLGLLEFGWDFGVLALFCMGILYLAMRYRLPAAETKAYIEKLHLNAQDLN